MCSNDRSSGISSKRNVFDKGYTLVNRFNCVVNQQFLNKIITIIYFSRKIYIIRYPFPLSPSVPRRNVWQKVWRRQHDLFGF